MVIDKEIIPLLIFLKSNNVEYLVFCAPSYWFSGQTRNGGTNSSATGNHSAATSATMEEHQTLGMGLGDPRGCTFDSARPSYLFCASVDDVRNKFILHEATHDKTINHVANWHTIKPAATVRERAFDHRSLNRRWLPHRCLRPSRIWHPIHNWGYRPPWRFRGSLVERKVSALNAVLRPTAVSITTPIIYPIAKSC